MILQILNVLINQFQNSMLDEIMQQQFQQTSKVFFFYNFKFKILVKCKFLSEVVVWKINSGKIVSEVDIGFKIKQLRISQNEEYVLILLQTNELVAYKNLKNKCKFNIVDEGGEKSSNLQLIDYTTTTKTETTEDTLFHLVDFDNYKLFEFIFNSKLETPIVKKYQLKDDVDKASLKDDIMIVTDCMEFLFINKDFKFFKTFQIDDKNTKTIDPKMVKFESTDLEKLLKQFFKINSVNDLKYKLINSYHDTFVITISGKNQIEKQRSRQSETVIKAKLKRQENEIIFYVEDIYLDCKNVCAQPEALCVHLIQNLNNKITENFILVKNYKTLSEYKLIIEQNVKMNLIAIDSNAEYLAYNDISKVVSLYRVDNGKKLASVPLYDYGMHMKFNLDGRFLCLTMHDRRIFSLLIVDPNNKKHANRISELSSRKPQLKQDTRRMTVIGDIKKIKKNFDKKSINEKMIEDDNLPVRTPSLDDSDEDEETMEQEEIKYKNKLNIDRYKRHFNLHESEKNKFFFLNFIF